MKNLHLRARALKWCFFIIFKTSMILPMGDLWLMENEFLHQLRYVNSPGFISGYLTMPYTNWCDRRDFFQQSRVATGLFLQKSHLADQTQEVQQHSKGMELLKAAWKATRELEWLVSTTLLVEPSREIFFPLRHFKSAKDIWKKTTGWESNVKEGAWVTSSYQPHSLRV